MFYSQTFLARKGPLGIVWCAAHLEHRLKKSHYTSVDISTTVEKIMFPEVPLALRMSSHLLCGVARVFAKQVDYLLHDCNVALTNLRKAFASMEVDLTVDARQVRVESVTLPQTFNLEDYVIDDDMYQMDLNDKQKSKEEITLPDQIPTETDAYIAINVDEDVFPESTPIDIDCFPTIPPSDELGNEAERMNEVSPDRILDPVNQSGVLDGTVQAQDVGPDKQTEIFDSTMEFHGHNRPDKATETQTLGDGDENIQESTPEIERIRDAGPELMPERDPLLHPDTVENMAEAVECTDRVSDKNGIRTPVLEEILAPERQSSGQRQSEPPAFDDVESPRNFGHSTPELALRPSPPAQQAESGFEAQQKRRPRKRKRFDKVTVLTNRFMKRSLEDSSHLLRKGSSVPASALGIWRLNSSARKENIFDEPIFTGFCADLCNTFRADYIASKPHLARAEESVAGSPVAMSPSHENEPASEPSHFNVQEDPLREFGIPDSPARETKAVPESGMVQSPYQTTEPYVEDMVGVSSHLVDNDMETENLRDSSWHELMLSPTGFSPTRQRDFDSSVLVESTGGATIFTPGLTASAATTNRSEAETARSIPEDLYGIRGTGLPDIPESDEGLAFLDSPSGSQTSHKAGSFSGRTRAVARYLKGYSSASPASEGPSDHLSLNRILEGKTRKLCARMFFETLVLKNNNLVDVQQDTPYGDITLKLSPALTKVLE